MLVRNECFGLQSAVLDKLYLLISASQTLFSLQVACMVAVGNRQCHIGTHINRSTAAFYFGVAALEHDAGFPARRNQILWSYSTPAYRKLDLDRGHFLQVPISLEPKLAIEKVHLEVNVARQDLAYHWFQLPQIEDLSDRLFAT